MSPAAVLASIALAAAPAPSGKRPATVFAPAGRGLVAGRLVAAIRSGIADSPLFHPPRLGEDDVQLVFTAPPRVLPAGRFAYAIDVLEIDDGTPRTVASLDGTCQLTRMRACSSHILAQAAHRLGD